MDKIMMQENTNLNLARKWRPQSFDHVVGQDVAIRMLKNSLYVNKFFPVYLFAGQRGCGKTSTARIFAAATNCTQLKSFQKDPTISIPCMTCPSCTAMLNGDHPDFIEIDAASHTGVDNVRQIIDASSYMPLMGNKKIYLIDEAHMLSKAAFNAFLKVLEEPPMGVVFILATTEVPKLPATVLSRCFQLIFNPINATSLKCHLKNICANENVNIDDAAIDILLDETEGSARDAINLLERVRFSSDHITEQTVLNVLGKISTKDLFLLFQLVIDQQASQVLEHLQTIQFEQRSPQLLWDMFIHICRTIIWIKYGIQNLPGTMARHINELKPLAQKCSINRLNAILNLLWAQEELFVRTNKKHLFLEMTLLQLCQQVDVADLEDIIKACKSLPNGVQNSTPKAPSTEHPTKQTSQQTVPTNTVTIAQTISQGANNQVPQEQIQVQTPPSIQTETNPAWNNFVQDLIKTQDPLLCSILMQSNFVKADEQTKNIVIQLSAESAFFKNKIEETKNLWLSLLTTQFPGYLGFTFIPRQQEVLKPIPKQPGPPITITRPAPPSATAPQQAFRRPAAKESDFLIIKDPLQWPKASLILKHFAGKIKKV
jgi:DNA polymerase-3 subunit gamma/tau